MRFLAFAKLFILVGALFVVIQIMHSTNPNAVTRFMATIGIETGGTTSSLGFHPSSGVASPELTPLNLCPTRIHAISWSDGRVIQESKDGMRVEWKAGEPVPHEIGAIEMEKWLSRHCQIEVEPKKLAAGESINFKPLFKVQYIDQASTELFRSDSGLYRFGETVFSSLDLNRAIGELTEVASFTKPANAP